MMMLPSTTTRTSSAPCVECVLAGPVCVCDCVCVHGHGRSMAGSCAPHAHRCQCTRARARAYAYSRILERLVPIHKHLFQHIHTYSHTNTSHFSNIPPKKRRRGPQCVFGAVSEFLRLGERFIQRDDLDIFNNSHCLHGAAQHWGPQLCALSGESSLSSSLTQPHKHQNTLPPPFIMYAKILLKIVSNRASNLSKHRR